MRNLIPRTGLLAVILSALLVAGCNTNAQQNQQLNVGYQQLGAGQCDAAIATANSFLAQTPTGPGAAEALYLKGRAFESKHAANAEQERANLAAARQAFEAALQQNPVRKTEGFIRTALSNVAFYQEDYLTALDQATRAYDLVDDPQVDAALLFRIGVSEQRLGRWTDADHTFDLVQERYGNTPLAGKAREREGMRHYVVQLATYGDTAAADAAAAQLRGSGFTSMQKHDDAGHILLDIGPFDSYQAAKDVAARYAAQFPQAVVIP